MNNLYKIETLLNNLDKDVLDGKYNNWYEFVEQYNRICENFNTFIDKCVYNVPSSKKQILDEVIDYVNSVNPGLDCTIDLQMRPTNFYIEMVFLFENDDNSFKLDILLNVDKDSNIEFEELRGESCFYPKEPDPQVAALIAMPLVYEMLNNNSVLYKYLDDCFQQNPQTIKKYYQTKHLATQIFERGQSKLL